MSLYVAFCDYQKPLWNNIYTHTHTWQVATTSKGRHPGSISTKQVSTPTSRPLTRSKDVNHGFATIHYSFQKPKA